MTEAQKLIEDVEADGVQLTIEGDAQLAVEGLPEQVQKWLQVVRENKQGVLAALGAKSEAAPETGNAPTGVGSTGAALVPLPDIETAPGVYLVCDVAELEAIERLRLTGTTLTQGSWSDRAWAEDLRGRTVAIIDRAREFAELALKALRGAAKQTFVVDLPADSVAAWVEQGGDRNELMRLTREAVERSQAESQTLEEILKGNAVAMYCDEISQTLWLVADQEDAVKLGERRGVVYTAPEIRLVASIDDPEWVRAAHVFKDKFNAEMKPPDRACGGSEGQEK